VSSDQAQEAYHSNEHVLHVKELQRKRVLRDERDVQSAGCFFVLCHVQPKDGAGGNLPSESVHDGGVLRSKRNVCRLPVSWFVFDEAERADVLPVKNVHDNGVLRPPRVCSAVQRRVSCFLFAFRFSNVHDNGVLRSPRVCSAVQRRVSWFFFRLLFGFHFFVGLAKRVAILRNTCTTTVCCDRKETECYSATVAM
jgi:hypothetical protein